VRRFRWIGIEDLAVAGMARTRLAKSVMDAAMAEVGRQLAYKAPLAGGNLVAADRWFPSSRRCHVCHLVNGGLRLGGRTWTCEGCRTTHDRDDNASQNLKQMAAAHAVTACCPGSSGPLGDEPSGWAGMGRMVL
jgi:putative transposase